MSPRDDRRPSELTLMPLMKVIDLLWQSVDADKATRI